MALGYIDAGTVFVEQEELFLHDSNIDELDNFSTEAVLAEQERDALARLKH